MKWMSPVCPFDGNGVAVKRCCARCRRGSLAYGLLPCGRDGACACHNDSLPPTAEFLPGLVLADSDEKLTAQIGTQSNEDSGGF